MANKKILGLDLGTNSIGWALINVDWDEKKGEIQGIGSRIIPMGADVLGKFDSGITESSTSNRTKLRSVRKLYQRDNLRRERLHRVLSILGFLPEHYKAEIDFETHYGQFINHAEPKVPYRKVNGKKHEFVFMDSFNEMVSEFKMKHPYLFENGKKIPYDWTIYFLRKKALTDKISKEEITWLLLNFNQKRGYYQLSEELDQDDVENKEYCVLNVLEVKDTGETIKKTGEKLYEVFFDNGWEYDKKITKTEAWLGQSKEFIVTTTTTKDGKIKRSYKAVDSEKDWIAIKKKTELDIHKSGKTVGEYIYNALIENPTQKINGKLVKTIERKFYKEELNRIIKTQIELHYELKDKSLYKACLDELYQFNDKHKENIKDRGFKYLFIEDIIFYQRPLKIKTHLISDCPLEFRFNKHTKTKVGVKCIAKSNPIFQEFRIWQFMMNLKIIEREKNFMGETTTERDVTSQYLDSEETYEKLFHFLNDKEESSKKVVISQKQFLDFFKLSEKTHRWNYVEDKEYPLNETRGVFLKRTKKISGINKEFFTNEITYQLWHIIYSVTDPEERKKAISTFALKHGLNEDFVISFSKFPPYKRDYGSFSEKAIKKFLKLMRLGSLWSLQEIKNDEKLYQRIDKILTAEFDEKISERVREKAIKIQKLEDFRGLPLWLASYIIYNKHSENDDQEKWNTSNDILHYLKYEFKQHSLRNPIVEQIISETLRVIKDIWDEFGYGEEGFFDEIHIELGREMKNPSDKRKRITEKNIENENTNQRIRAVLQELKQEINGVKPYSPSQQEILKIYEEGVYQNEQRKDELDVVDKIRKIATPSNAEIKKYKLWLEQGYISPYTGKVIRLSELFTTKYQIEHIFPQSRFFDDSLSNKIICESEVNTLKDNQTAMEFIERHGGESVTLSGGQLVTILSKENYKQHVLNYFSKNKIKKENLLAVDLPESFINRQLNDSRYISKLVKNYMNKIVRVKEEQEGTSKNVLPLNGAITSKMKQQWGLNDVWNDIITPRFERMNEITNSLDYGRINPNTGKFLPAVPNDIISGFNKKRIDHRHHALDALVIACVSRNHINYLNNLNARNEDDKNIKYELRNKLCFVEKVDDKGRKKWGFIKPWITFTQDAKKVLESTLVSFKQSNRVINKTKNKYYSYKNEDGSLRLDKNGKPKKELTMQVKGDNWAVRKSLHKATIYGKVTLLRNNKVIDATAGRVVLTEKFTAKQLEKITDNGIYKILSNHLNNYLDKNNKPNFSEAFAPEGIVKLNENIVSLNNGKFHQPIYSVRLYEEGKKFKLGFNGSKNKKYVEADKDTNVCFAIYEGKKPNERDYASIPLFEVVENLKQGLPAAPPTSINNKPLLFTLAPDDLVYVPTPEEFLNPGLININNLTKNQVERIYRMVSCTGKECHFIRCDISTLIKKYDSISKIGELGSLNKNEKSVDGVFRIKENCFKLLVSRTGKIKCVITNV